MKDNDVQSASSIISDNERDRILGRRNRRRRIKPKLVLSDSPGSTIPKKKSVSVEEIPPKQKSSSFEIVSRNLEDPPKTSSKTKNSSFEIVSYNLEDSPKTSNRSESFVIVSKSGISNQEERSKESLTRKSETYDMLKRSRESIISMNGSKESFKKDSIVCLCKECCTKNGNQKKNGKVQTQTVGIQTSIVISEADCRCSWRSRSCDCKPYCNCPQCVCNLIDKEVNVPEKSSKVLEDRTETSSQTTATIEPYNFNNNSRCNCCQAQSSTDLFSEDSDDSYTTDFFDLPYQNNEEYLKLLKELEKKLIARNRERVKKTMLEFEKRSRQNQNLDKPIFDYDYSDDNACILRKLVAPSPRGRYVCSKCGKKKSKNVNSDIMQNEKRWNKADFAHNKTSDPQTQNVSRSVHKSHWQLDPRSGEWIKVSCFQQTDYARHPFPPGDGLRDDRKNHVPPIGHTKDCQCRKKRH